MGSEVERIMRQEERAEQSDLLQTIAHLRAALASAPGTGQSPTAKEPPRA